MNNQIKFQPQYKTGVLLSPKPKYKSLDDLSINDRARMVVKLCLLGALAWDYTDTVLNLAAQMKIQETKALSRAVRQLKREYDQYRSGIIRDKDIRHEKRLSELFEDINSTAFSRLCQGLNTEIGHSLNLTPEYASLVCAVQMAMTVIDAMKLYAADCVRWMRDQGIQNPGIMPPFFPRLAQLLPAYAGDCYDPKSESRRITAHILFKEVNAIELYDENGLV